jgi:peptidoglycan hydrolase CwlO-like protein
MDPVVRGIYNPIEANTNQTLGALSGLLGLPSPLNVDVTGLLTTAASGSNIGVKVVASDGTLVGPADQCDATADSFTLDTPAGIAIGGNQITGLGDPAQQAVAGEIDSVAIGNRASTDATATNSIAIGTDASVGAGASGSIAFGNNASATALNSVALGAGSLADRANTISVGSVGSERQIVNVAAGTQSTDAVNLGQLNAVQALIPTNPVQYDDATHSTVTLDGAGGTRLTNLQPGAVTASSTDAVNGSQLFGVQTQVNGIQAQVTTNTTDISNLQGQVGTNTTDIANLQTQVGNNTTDITNLQTDVGNLQTQVATNTTDITNLQTQVSTNTTDISNLQTNVTGLQTQVTSNTTDITNLQGAVGGNTTAITNLQTDVANNTTDITNLQTNVAGNTTAITNLTVAVQNGAVGPVQYSNAATPTTPNGGTPSNDVTLVGGAPGPVAVHNVADGVVAAGSTDAINGGQLFDALDDLPGFIDAVTYDDSTHTAITLNSGGSSTVIHNVAPGVAPTDAVNVAQLNSGMSNAISVANAYTDARLDAVNFDLRRARHEARSGTAAALAAAGMPQAMEAGRTMIAGGMGTYRGKVGFAAGASYRASNGKSIYRLGVSYDSSEHFGANLGAGVEF